MVPRADYKWGDIITPSTKGTKAGTPVVVISSRGVFTLNRHFVSRAKNK